MDKITRAVELAKARTQELDAALIEIALQKADASGDYEGLTRRIREIVVILKSHARELRAGVAQHEPDRN